MNNEQESEIKRLGLIEIVPCKEEKRDKKGNILWIKYSNGTTEERKYNDNGKMIWYKDTKKIYHIGNKEYRKVISLDKEELK